MQEFNVDAVMARNEDLEKTGRWGKFLARNRKHVVLVSGILMGLGCFFILWAFGNVIMYMFRTVAAGIDHFADPSSVILGTAGVVNYVTQPKAILATASQASMVINDVNAKLVERTVLTESIVGLGYLQWRPISGLDMRNFTLGHMKFLAKSTSATLPECACLCYTYFGIPENIVYVARTDEVLYEPRMVSETPANSSVPVKPCNCTARTLVSDIVKMRKRSWFQLSYDPAERIAESGIVHYVTHNGALKNRAFAQPELACIKECISYFQ